MSVTAFSPHMVRTLLPILEKKLSWDEEYTKSAQDLISLKVYFETTEVTIIETGEKTPIMTFIGNVGGQLGNKNKASHFAF